MSWLKKLSSGLSRTSNKITQGITDVITKRKLDDEVLEELEDLLIRSDMGVKLASNFVNEFGKSRFNKEVSEEEVRQELASYVARILDPVAQNLPQSSAAPEVFLMVGVNGNGKTTTAGKLAAQYKAQGKKVMMAACDTFRAAAVEQLQVWGERVGCEVVVGAHQSDPASVAYAAFEKAKAEKADVLLIDTAGRLQTKTTLMEELGKIRRVLAKIDETAPHHTILVLDATTGQNAHSQVDAFKAASQIDGLIVTKLDGTAKGGVVVALADKYGLPIYAIGVGEAVDDMQPFEAQEFAKNLVGVISL